MCVGCVAGIDGIIGIDGCGSTLLGLLGTPRSWQVAHRIAQHSPKKPSYARLLVACHAGIGWYCI